MLTLDDYEEYLVRKIIDSGIDNPTMDNCLRYRYLIDWGVIQNYLDEKRENESPEDYATLMAKIEALRDI